MTDRVQLKQLPKLIVPRGAPVKPTARMVPAAQGKITSLTKAQIIGIAGTMRPVEIVLPWATLSARKPYVKDKADAIFWKVGHVSGYGDEVNLASSWAAPDASISVALPKIQPGQLFLVVVNGWCNGSGVIRYESENGSGDIPVSQGAFNFPIALTDTDDDAYLAIKVKTKPVLLSVKSIDIWKVD